MLNQSPTSSPSKAVPSETLLLLAHGSVSHEEFSFGDLRVGEGSDVVIASGTAVPPHVRLAWEQRGFRVIESRGGRREDLCAAGMAAAAGHVVRVRDLSEVLVIREVVSEVREAARPR